MESSPALSPLEVAAVNLRVIWRAVLAGLGAWGVAPERQMATYNWISLRFARFEALLARYRAGTLRRVVARAVTPGRTITRKPAVRMPRKWAWLVLTGKHHAAGFGGQLQHTVLNTPEMAELLETVPQAKRILRPLLRALAVELPWTMNRPRAETTPRIRKPRPKRPVYPEDIRCPLPRGVKAWVRKQKQIEQALKLKHELIAKMPKGRPW